MLVWEWVLLFGVDDVDDFDGVFVNLVNEDVVWVDDCFVCFFGLIGLVEKRVFW